MEAPYTKAKRAWALMSPGTIVNVKKMTKLAGVVQSQSRRLSCFLSRQVAEGSAVRAGLLDGLGAYKKLGYMLEHSSSKTKPETGLKEAWNEQVANGDKITSHDLVRLAGREKTGYNINQASSALCGRVSRGQAIRSGKRFVGGRELICYQKLDGQQPLVDLKKFRDSQKSDHESEVSLTEIFHSFLEIIDNYKSQIRTLEETVARLKLDIRLQSKDSQTFDLADFGDKLQAIRDESTKE